MPSLTTVTCGFLLGLLIPVSLSAAIRTLLAISSLSVGLLLAAARGREIPPILALLAPGLVGLASLMAGLAVGSPARAPPVVAPAGLARMLVSVEEVSHTQGGQGRSRARVLEGKRLEDGVVIPTGLRVTVLPDALPEGASVEIVARLSPRVPFRNPSPHTALASARATQAYAILVGADAARVVEHHWPARVLWACRQALRARLDASLPPDVAAVARALTLGDPDALSENEQAEVRASGLAHVFAVSGMHVSLLAGLLVLGLMRVFAAVYPIASRYDTGRIAHAVGIPLALGIGAFTGAAPSGVRAALTSAFSWSLTAAGRRPDPAAVTGATCLAFAAVAPSEAMRPAFLLSIAATAAIVSMVHAQQRSLRQLVAAAVQLSLRTSLATAPIVLWTFGTLPVWGVIANLLFVPVGSALLVLSVLHALVGCVCPPASFVTALPLELASRGFLSGCAWFAAIDPAWTWPVLSDAQGVLGCLAVAFVLFRRRGRLRTVALVICGVGIALAEWRLRMNEKPTGVLRATFLDVGQGDATLIDFPDGRAMLVDGGGSPNGGADPGSRALVPLLAARRRAYLDVVVLSHPHPDHYQGLAAVAEAVSIGEVWDTGQAHAEADRSSTAAEARSWLERARAKGARVRAPPELCDQAHRFGEAVVQVQWPCPAYDPGSDPNDNSFVLRVRYRQQSLLLSGDIEAHAEAALVQSRRELRATVLKVPHHGSATSSGPAFLRAVSPKLAVISAGLVNRFGHPHADVLHRLQASGARVIELGRAGGTLVTTDGRTLELESWAR